MAGKLAVGIEAGAIVADLQGHRRILAVQAHAAMRRAAVPAAVVQRFLGDAKENFLRFQRQVRLLA